MQDVQVRAARTVAAVLAGRSLSAELAVVLEQPPALFGGDRGQLQDLCYGTLRFLGELRAVASALVDRQVSDPLLQALLWVALYQLRHTRAAPYAVVDGAVEACPEIGSARARGLVNAVLRNALRRSHEMDAVARGTDLTRYSFPQWWIDRTRVDLPDHWREVLLASNSHPPFTLRINPRRTSVDDFVAACVQQGIEAVALRSTAAWRLPPASAVWGTKAVAQQMPLAQCVRLPRAVPVETLPGFSEGWFSVQDAGAQLAGALMAPRDGERILDACAAPGGKTTHLLELADIELTAIDSDATRMKRVSSNLERLGQKATLRAADAAHVASWWDGRPFDRILLDAPCSGSGVVRRHPDIKWLRRSADLPRLAAQQRRLLEALWPLLAPGGHLVYCTCSVFQVENEAVMNAFLAAQPGARRVSCGCQVHVRQDDVGQDYVGKDDVGHEDVGHEDVRIPAAASDAVVTADGGLRLLPDSEHDGFHYALLSKF